MWTSAQAMRGTRGAGRAWVALRPGPRHVAGKVTRWGERFRRAGALTRRGNPLRTLSFQHIPTRPSDAAETESALKTYSATDRKHFTPKLPSGSHQNAAGT